MLALANIYCVVKCRKWFLSALLLGLVSWYFVPMLYERCLLGWYPQSTCDGAPPPWLGELEALGGELGYPGFQLAALGRDGRAVRCAAGWSGLGFPPQRMGSSQRLMYASLSKIFTSIVVLQLVDEQRLSLDKALMDVLDIHPPYVDPRVADISLRHLLRHRAGFDREITPDPMLKSNPWCPEDSKHMQQWRLDFSPGARFAYANLGYCLAGVAIEKLDAQPLATSIQKRVFHGLGISAVAPLAGHFDSTVVVPKFDSKETEDDLLQLNWRSMVATGAWAGSAGDLLSVLKGAFRPTVGDVPLLTPSARAAMLAEDFDCHPSGWRKCHGLLFYKYRDPSGVVMYWRDGSLPGATGFAAIYEDGRMVVFLANFRRANWMPDNDRIGHFFASIR